LHIFRKKIDLYWRLMRLDKPVVILLVLWPTLWALWFSATGAPEPRLVWVFVLGMVIMHSAGCVINDVADRNFDPHVQRTQDRPLASGKVTVKEALILFTALILAAFFLIFPYLDVYVFGLAVAAVFLVISYPLTKRVLAIPQAYLGIAFGFSIPMVYAVQQGGFPGEIWLLMLANMFWTIAYDTEYAMVDREDDLKIGIKTSAITFGRFDVAAIMFCYAMMLGLMAFLGYLKHRGTFFYLGIFAAGAVALYHFALIRHREPRQCLKAFLHNNWIGFFIFAGIVLDYAHLSGWLK